MRAHTIRTRFKKDIISEVGLPDKQTGRVLILIGGLPSIPSKPDVLKFWVSAGYVCVFPRFRGTWESGGEFLKRDPVLDVFDIVDEMVSSKSILNLYTGETEKIKVSSIYVVGGSFGGTGALLASAHPKVKKVVALSPVIDWSIDSEAEPFEFFQRFTKNAFGEAYRSKASSWKKLQHNKIYSPIQKGVKIIGEKILIVHAENDSVVPIDPVYSFVRDTNSELVEMKKGGHFGLNDTRKKKFTNIIIKHLG